LVKKSAKSNLKQLGIGEHRAWGEAPLLRILRPRRTVHPVHKNGLVFNQAAGKATRRKY